MILFLFKAQLQDRTGSLFLLISSNLWWDLTRKSNTSFKALCLWIPSLRSFDRGFFFWTTLDPTGLIKGSRTAAEAFRKPLGPHYRSVTLGGREPSDLCPQRTGESWKGLSQAVAAICRDASSFLFHLSSVFNQSILASPLCPLRCPQPLSLTPAPTSAIWFSPCCPLAPALWTDYKWHLNNHFPIQSDRQREREQTDAERLAK